MNLLLDTHVLLWWLDDAPTLSRKAKAALIEGENLVFISAVVIWEIKIKQALGKLKIPSDFRSVLDDQPFRTLNITVEHAHAIGELPAHHNDPFDRMLVAQAKVERLDLVTRDIQLKKYGIKILEA
ncbi:MAG: type II toxin-antitoxin system VapC family toxin [Deltaproteobacteria bacterium]|nr:type II toxin-antitoxin system VapC family toxin [Deltaproteobacteria bacterium]